MRLLTALALLVAAACGNPTVLDGKKYATQCTVAADCAAVFLGDQCTVCGCPNAAISRSDKVAYDADRSAAVAGCGPRPDVACAACETKPAGCDAGACSL